MDFLGKCMVNLIKVEYSNIDTRELNSDTSLSITDEKRCTEKTASSQTGCQNPKSIVYDQNLNCIDVKNEPSLTSTLQVQTWKTINGTCSNTSSYKTLSELLKIPTTINQNLEKKEPDINGNLKVIKEENNNIANYGGILTSANRHVDSTAKRMSTGNHGQDTSRMTGSSQGGNTTENLSWLANVTTSQNQPTQQPSEGMLSGRPGQAQDTAMLASAASPGVFRPPTTVADPSQRLLSSGGQYATLYSGGNSSLSPYPTMHSGQVAVAGQSSHLQSPYSAFYPQFATHGYSHRSMLSGHYPHIESYSAVLQSMGSQVHAVQSQLPRNAFLPGHVPQYSLLGASHQRSMSASTSPGPSSGIRQSPISSGGFNPGESTLTDLKSSLKNEDGRERDMEPNITGVNYASHIKEERAHSLSTLELSGGKSVSFKDPPRRDLFSSSKDFNNKVPSGKEGSLKHRILRPSDSAIESSTVDARYSSFSNRSFTEPYSKRSRQSYDDLSSSGKSGNSGEDVESTGPSHLHYPLHFMKGSIIQLTNGELKRVEDLQTEDFVHSAEISNDLKIDSSTVVRIEENLERGTAILGFVVGEHRVQVTVEATLEHPFFVFGQGWSACEPERTRHRYSLECHKLTVGDVCVSLTHKDAAAKAAELSKIQQQQQMSLSSSAASSHFVSSTTTMATSGVKSTVSSSNQQNEVPSFYENMNKQCGNNLAAHLHDSNGVQLDSSRPPRKRNWSSSQDSHNHRLSTEKTDYSNSKEQTEVRK